MPDNNSKDPDIEYLLMQVKSWPDDGLPVSLVGAEPTVRKDLADLVLAIQALPGKPRTIIIVTNEACIKIYNSVAVYLFESIFKTATATVGINIKFNSTRLQFSITSII
jgi:hypothetical protein